MKPLTVKELASILDGEIKKGNGDFAVVVSDDDECNGYHCLWNFYGIEYGEPTTYVDKTGRHTIETILLS